MPDSNAAYKLATPDVSAKIRIIKKSERKTPVFLYPPALILTKDPDFVKPSATELTKFIKKICNNTRLAPSCRVTDGIMYLEIKLYNMKKQLPDIIATGVSIFVNFVKEEDLMLEALITLAVLSFLIFII